MYARSVEAFGIFALLLVIGIALDHFIGSPLPKQAKKVKDKNAVYKFDYLKQAFKELKYTYGN